MQTACLVIAIISGIAMLFYGFITNHTVYNYSATDMKGILICVFMILILASAGIAKYLDDKREAKENDE